LRRLGIDPRLVTAEEHEDEGDEDEAAIEKLEEEGHAAGVKWAGRASPEQLRRVAALLTDREAWDPDPEEGALWDFAVAALGFDPEQVMADVRLQRAITDFWEEALPVGPTTSEETYHLLDGFCGGVAEVGHERGVSFIIPLDNMTEIERDIRGIWLGS
jgi:hypothetical protein